MCKAYAVLNSSYPVGLLDLVGLLGLGHLGRKKSERMQMFGLSVVEEFYCLEQLTCLIWLTRLPHRCSWERRCRENMCMCMYVRIHADLCFGWENVRPSYLEDLDHLVYLMGSEPYHGWS